MNRMLARIDRRHSEHRGNPGRRGDHAYRANHIICAACPGVEGFFEFLIAIFGEVFAGLRKPLSLSSQAPWTRNASSTLSTFSAVLYTMMPGGIAAPSR